MFSLFVCFIFSFSLSFPFLSFVRLCTAFPFEDELRKLFNTKNVIVLVVFVLTAREITTSFGGPHRRLYMAGYQFRKFSIYDDVVCECGGRCVCGILEWCTQNVIREGEKRVNDKWEFCYYTKTKEIIWYMYIYVFFLYAFLCSIVL